MEKSSEAQSTLMDKQMFLSSPDPLILIVSTDLTQNKSCHDTYHANDASYWIEKFEQDFPDSIITFYYNPAAIEERKAMVGMTAKK